MAHPEDSRIGQALVDFSLNGTFPEEEESSQQVTVQDLAPALESLVSAKSKLESEIHQINEETAPDVNQWLINAKSLEDDINRSRSLANEIVRRSEAPEVSGQTILEAEEKVDFLKRETSYNRQVNHALTSIKHVNGLLDQVEQARDERRILDSLHLLEQAWTALDNVPVSKSCRVMKLLDMRAFELKSAVHDVFDRIWNSLVQIDSEKGKVTVYENRQDEPMSLSDAVIGLKAYKEVNQRMALLWHSVDEAIISPRTDLNNSNLPSIITDYVSLPNQLCRPKLIAAKSTLSITGNSDRKVTALFSELERAMEYFSKRLPEELVHSLSNVMMPVLIPRLITVWLDSAVPASLSEMEGFSDIVEAVISFCDSLHRLHYSGFEELQEWVDNVPRVWLSKCRETALGSIRSRLAGGLGDSKVVERVETQVVSKSEGRELAANGATGDDSWDAAWSDGETGANKDHNGKPEPTEDDGADNWGWGNDDDAAGSNPEEAKRHPQTEASIEEDDALEAWGWGDEDATQETPAQPAPNSKEGANKEVSSQTREITLKETYNISAMPEPVLALISAVLEDGALLVASPVASAAAGLFSLPTLILALFRAVSPYYYALSDGGNMFLYNDATYLSERLSDLTSTWKARDDLAPRAITMLRLDNDIKTLQSFAARAYALEMSTQRTILRDLLGGSQNVLQQDGLDSSDLEAQVDNAIGRVRAVAATWSNILSRSAWTQAVGSIVDTVSSKLIADVMDLADIGQEEAYNIASLIARIEQLDSLFLPPDAGKDAIPNTAQYAASWLRLKYLSEVLQSNLQEVLYLWNESELSLEFSAKEVIELIRLSFVDNVRTRDVIREIESRPHPRGPR
ncbi:hypothetical protein DL766_005098 [Monosporascus sp. MC13-8B]|uniref:ZW10 C-terminal helical domain-containing protein n=1 Tax=Monosporascus cannonballus TaxID=155416 RepID=A0ABY0HHW2_9PEZI|nr:hypothetical protein DL762_000866 [Monosporascus cannonballus]RYO95664.1 hypothetical protein DL763_003635 [Monosporascus cannonballus]RYP30021.1 hypothetical protein DL766_005098 [Monosporascus sp. MC13-8B]